MTSNRTQNKPTHEITLTIKWYPTLGNKSPEAELGSIIAHNQMLLDVDGMEVVSSKITKKR